MKKYFLQVCWILLATSCAITSSLGAVKETANPLTPAQAISLLGGETQLSMHLQNATPEAFYKELWLNAHLGEYTFASRVSSQKKPLITMDKEDAPFWDVVRDFALQANSSIAMLSSFPMRGRLQPSVSTDGIRGIKYADPPFLFTIDKVKHTWNGHARTEFGELKRSNSNNAYLSLRMFNDPKLQMIFDPEIAHLMVTQLKNNQGKSMISENPLEISLNGGGYYSMNIYVPLLTDALNAKDIDVFQGYVQAPFISKSKIWAIPDIAHAVGVVYVPLADPEYVRTSATPDVARYKLSSVQEIGGGYSVVLSFARSRTQLQFNRLTELFVNGLEAFDADGNRLAVRFDTHINFSKIRFKDEPQGKYLQGADIHFRILWTKQSHRGPVTLQCRLPLEFRTVKVPFEFHNIPLR